MFLKKCLYFLLCFGFQIFRVKTVGILLYGVTGPLASSEATVRFSRKAAGFPEGTILQRFLLKNYPRLCYVTVANKRSEVGPDYADSFNSCSGVCKSFLFCFSFYVLCGVTS